LFLLFGVFLFLLFLSLVLSEVAPSRLILGPESLVQLFSTLIAEDRVESPHESEDQEALDPDRGVFQSVLVSDLVFHESTFGQSLGLQDDFFFVGSL
jgi:hypothetical protein